MSAVRERLPDTRPGVIHHFTVYTRTVDKDGNAGVKEVKGYIRANVYPDGHARAGKLAEVFLTLGKPGDENAWGDQWSIPISLGLQYGIPVEVMLGKHVGTQWGEFGATKNKDIPRCTSVLDYVARFLLKMYGPKMPVIDEEVTKP